MALLLVATPALAQPPRPERPYRGLFGSGVGDADELLAASGSILAGTTTTVCRHAGRQRSQSRKAAPARVLLRARPGRSHTRSERSAITFGRLSAPGTRYYPDTSDDLVTATQGGLTLTASPRLGTSLSLGLFGRLSAISAVRRCSTLTSSRSLATH